MAKKPEKININKSDLLLFFIEYVHKIHAAKRHLVVRLSELKEEAWLTDLKNGIQDTIEDVNRQIERLKEIYVILEITAPDDHSLGDLHQLAEGPFVDIKRYTGNPELRDMTMLFYLLNIESIEMSSFQILQMLAVKLKNDEIKMLVKANYEDAKAGKTLFKLIAAKYIASA